MGQTIDDSACRPAVDFTYYDSQNESMATKAISRPRFDATSVLTLIRLSLQGALLGVAVVGVFTQAQHYDIAGALIGGLVVLFAKIKHVF